MEISDEELSAIKAKSIIAGSLTVMRGFKIGLKESSRFVHSMTMTDLLEIVDECIKEIEEEAKNL